MHLANFLPGRGPFAVRAPSGNTFERYLARKQRPIPVFRKWGAVRNGMGRSRGNQQGATTVQSVPGALGATMANQVGAAYGRSRVRLGRSGSTFRRDAWEQPPPPWRAGGVPSDNASIKPTPGASARLGAPPPYPRPQAHKYSSGHAPLEQERRRVKAIRPFPPLPCGPFP